MPRASKEQATLHRASITESAARLIREHGIAGVSVADAMGGAGLTHGGFYGHFASKDALVAAACAAAFDQAVDKWRARVSSAADDRDARRVLIDRYVSAAARDSPSSSCPASALASDVARESATAPIRAAYRLGVESLIDILAQLQPGENRDIARRAAIADFALMIGSVVLARATRGAPLSDEVLEVCRTHLDPPAEV